MEMPEGWKFANNLLVEGYFEGWKRRSEWAFEATELMKEMAEVMERIQFCMEHPASCELTAVVYDDALAEMSKWMETVLKKWREWK